MANQNSIKQEVVTLAKELKYTNQQIISLNKFSTFAREWQDNVISPFMGAYETAFVSFKAVQAADVAADKARMELAFMALSLFGGSAFTAIFGKATLNQVMGNMGTKFLIDNNMNRTFDLLKLAKDNPVAGYVTAQTVSATQKWISGKTNTVIADAGKSSTYSNITSITSMSRGLNMFYGKLETSVRYAFNDLLENKKGIDLESRRQALNCIMQSPFCQSPKQTLIKPKELAEKIELGFYMKLLLESDYKQDVSVIYSLHASVGKEMPINVSANSPTYPTQTAVIPGAKRGGTNVGYRLIGSAACTQMNTLYKKIMNEKSDILNPGLITQRANKEVLKKAENVLNVVATETYDAIKQRVQPIKPLPAAA